MTLSLVQYLLGFVSGAFVGFSLGLVGGGGSILAVPLMVYLVGVPNPHLAIGTSVLAVAASAAANLVTHGRRGAIKWGCAGVFAAAGLVGNLAGSTLGKAFNGRYLLALFAVLMLVVAALMLRRRQSDGDSQVSLNWENAPKLVGAGVLTGALSGFFGIGGGFLIVPALIAATGMPILNAVGSSLVAVTVFGLATALNYAMSGWVDWMLAGVFLVGGVGGGLLGGRLAGRISVKKGALNLVFAGVISCVAVFVLIKSMIFN